MLDTLLLTRGHPGRDRLTSKNGTPEPVKTQVKPLRAQDKGMPDFGTHNPLEGAT